jgi:hypothetical protein
MLIGYVFNWTKSILDNKGATAEEEEEKEK